MTGDSKQRTILNALCLDGHFVTTNREYMLELAALEKDGYVNITKNKDAWQARLAEGVRPCNVEEKDEHGNKVRRLTLFKPLHL